MPTNFSSSFKSENLSSTHLGINVPHFKLKSFTFLKLSIGKIPGIIGALIPRAVDLSLNLKNFS
jgi:hypothetical protein